MVVFVGPIEHGAGEGLASTAADKCGEVLVAELLTATWIVQEGGEVVEGSKTALDDH